MAWEKVPQVPQVPHAGGGKRNEEESVFHVSQVWWPGFCRGLYATASQPHRSQPPLLRLRPPHNHVGKANRRQPRDSSLNSFHRCNGLLSTPLVPQLLPASRDYNRVEDGDFCAASTDREDSTCLLSCDPYRRSAPMKTTLGTTRAPSTPWPRPSASSASDSRSLSMRTASSSSATP